MTKKMIDAEPQEIQLTLDNLNILLNCYHRDIIKTVLLNNVYDKILYTHRPKRMSIYKFVKNDDDFHDKSVREITYKGLTYFRVFFLMFKHEKYDLFDEYSKEFLENRIK